MKRPLLPSFLLSVCFLSLLACEQTIVQKTTVPAPIVNIQLPASAPPASRPPSQPAARAPRDSGPSPSVLNAGTAPQGDASPSPLPELSLAPISGPSASPLIPADLDRFADAIPEPQSTQSYDLHSIELAALLWQQRYERLRQDPYQVLLMYLDAGMLAWYNEALAARLNRPLLTSKTPWLFPDYPARDAGALAKAKEFAIRSYFRDTRPVDNYALPDFAARTANLVSKNSRGEYIALSPRDARLAAPAVPRSGDVVRYHLLSSATGKDAELTLVYQDKGWKIDFWTPNILVLFLD